MKLKAKKKQGSTNEDYRFEALKLLEQKQEISYLKPQPCTLVVTINHKPVFEYTPDFRYFDEAKQVWVFEEYKGWMRERHDSLLRMKCASAIYPEEFRLYEGSGKKARLTRVYKDAKAIRQSKKKV